MVGWHSIISFMAQPRFVENSITIHSSPEKIWDALVNPLKTKKYMFGCEAVSDWSRGSSLLWRGQMEGKEMVFVQGVLLDIQPGKLLVYTTFDPHSDLEDVPENYLTVTYRLESADDGVLLTVSQGDFSTVANGEKRYEEVSNHGEGWNPILVQIKELVESSD